MTEKFVSIHGVRVQKIDQQKHGRLTTIGPKFRIGHPSYVVVRCDCGTVAVKNYHSVKTGATSSCGCFLREQMSRRMTVHGCARDGHMTTEYGIWTTMNQRCSNPNAQNYWRYGGSGICVCKQWKHDFKQFIADVGPRPSRKHSLDRFPNGSGNYEPGNVRWATVHQQNSNQRRRIKIEINGNKKSIYEWAREIGVVSGSTAYQRIKNGWNASVR